MLERGKSDTASSVQESRFPWFITCAATTCVLLIPAVFNRFPFVFPDTSAYLSVAYADSWPIDRAGFYGLLLSPALLVSKPSEGAWLAVTVQSAIIALILIATFRRFLPNSKAGIAFALVSATVMVTTLAWHATQLMPDAFTGALILLVWLAGSRDLSDRGTALLWLGIIALTLVHLTHVGLVLVAVTSTLIVCAFAGTPAKEIAKRGLAAILTIVAVLAAHTAVYGAYFNRWTPSPLGGYFLFARLNEDGLVPRWFDRHCDVDAPKPLCDLRPEIPRDSQALLWGKTPSPLYDRINKRKGEPDSWRWVDMVTEAANGALKEQPLAFASVAARATADQLLHYQALDDECPENCRNLKLFEWRPSLIEPVRTSRQLTGELPRYEIRLVTTLTSTVGLVLLLPLLAMAIRRRDTRAASLILTIVLCLIANAAMAGALSDVHDRYQSRIIWLAPFASLLVIARWKHETEAAGR